MVLDETVPIGGVIVKVAAKNKYIAIYFIYFREMKIYGKSYSDATFISIYCPSNFIDIFDYLVIYLSISFRFL